ncbi:uncharacterized protein J7T54_005473 [Emericellopsis cladophorae]|uniref:Knr4/Smi1-like domain-containing protein n=1 Tax=Emericellopsis cladophorae TaxID=2686198 RepID=A0A9Q0BAL5_9HYPO|nr:uncharacterized protein J7T54_005473 [Emericellopsis cladophorae]KAI6777680.1 hypothetical protein J7T54_005473 [Emericellopsis cladophorae]
MPAEYMDACRESGHPVPAPHSISRLVSSYMEPKNPSKAVRESFRIVELLLLSNHLDHAHSLATALYRHVDTILPKNASRFSQQALNYFWFTHPAYPLPPNAPSKTRQGDRSEAALKTESRWKTEQWNNYRECTRTGWMLEHCNLREPEDPHVWRETDNPPMIAMCARLLAKDKTPGHYPPTEQLREALAAAEKLYAQPQVPVADWKFEHKESQTVRRHSYLLYRRLVVELAIRVGRLDTAAEVLSQGLVLDGFNTSDGAALDRFLVLPGIYEVLPRLAAKGRAGNPFYIEDSDAAAMVREISQTLERRAEHGRQWSLAPERVGWRELLDRLASAAWAVNSKEYKKNGVMSAAEILNSPIKEEDIKAAEEVVGELPEDLKEMYRIAGGFKGGWHFLEGGLSDCRDFEFDPDCEELDDLRDEKELSFPNDDDDDNNLQGFIELSPGVEQCDSYRHYLITPALYRKLARERDDYKEGEYMYWNKAYWTCGTFWYGSVREWVAKHVERLERMVEDGEVEDGQDEDDCSTVLT